MQTFSVTTATDKDAATLMDFLTTIPGIETIDLERQTVRFVQKNGTIDKGHQNKEPYDWQNPTRPATHDEWEEMLDEAEAEYKNGLGMSGEVAKAANDKIIKQWISKKKT